MKLITLACLTVTVAVSQAAESHLPTIDAEKIADGSRAGPTFIKDATLLDWPSSPQRRISCFLRKSTNEWTCLTLRHCMATATIVLLDLGRLACIGLQSRRALAADNLYLRKQLALFHKRNPKARRADDSTRWIVETLSQTVANAIRRTACAARPIGHSVVHVLIHGEPKDKKPDPFMSSKLRCAAWMHGLSDANC